MTLVLILLWLASAVVLAPMLVLIVECLASLLPTRKGAANSETPRPRCAIIVPAHDEEGGIAKTIAGLRPQLGADDCLLVVADNCTDKTAEVARAAGATVIERADPERRGKGYALDFGVRQLEKNLPPAIVIIVDADCLVREGAIDRLVHAAAATGRPVQAAYLLNEPPDAGNKQRLSAFAFKFKNLIRPLGLHRLGFPCMLTGTGMAFPWTLLQKASLASGNIVEDMKLGVDLALAGFPPLLCPEASVSGELPVSGKAAVKQRKRWEHGHLQTLLTQTPRLMAAGLRQRRSALMGMAAELSVPPLSMLFLAWAGVLAAALAFWYWAEVPYPAIVLAAAGLAVALAMLAAWFKFGRQQLPFTVLLTVPFYVLWKVPLYVGFLFKREKAWVRTERNQPPPGPKV